MNRRQFICASVASLAVIGAHSAVASQQNMIVYKDPNCGCCAAWAKALTDADINVDIREIEDLDAVKRKYGVPQAAEGCHTAVLGPYFIEGHVPLEAVERLQTEAPDILGISVPGMPVGSLGMGDDPSVAAYDVMSVSRSGAMSVYMSVRPKKS
jgi:hypothetical protein